MLQGTPSRVAARLLHLLLPLCILAAAGVAVAGLFRSVAPPPAEPHSDPTPSLRLGGPSAGAVTPLPAATLSPIPHPSPSSTPPPPRVVSPVVVINASNITGLAGRTAQQLRRRGISVAFIGNMETATRPDTRTVFYPPGGQTQAEVLASLANAPAVAPAPVWLREGGKLVLVVTAAGTSRTS